MSTRLHIPAADPNAKVTTDFLLGQIALDLYRLADGQAPAMPLAMPVIASPEIATEVLRDESSFAKEYRFLEMLARGRFTANGSDWRRRTPLTQPFYRGSTDAISESEIEALYENSLRRRLSPSPPSLFQCFLDAAVGVMARAFGLDAPLAWPAAPVAEARKMLRIPLCYSLCGYAERSSAEVCNALAGFFGEVEAIWKSDAAMRSLLATLDERAAGWAEFSATGEMIQNVMAASETTASALLWTVEALARFPDEAPETPESSHDRFIDEVLRLFPPIPLVIRRCTEATVAAGMEFVPDEIFAISFVGMHCHAGHWARPLSFLTGRAEWAQPAQLRQAFQPFSMGPRLCGGARLAAAELRAGLRAFRRLFQVEPWSAPLAIEYGLTSRPPDRIEATVHPRAGIRS